VEKKKETNKEITKEKEENKNKETRNDKEAGERRQ
jgi:hypothetical protein